MNSSIENVNYVAGLDNLYGSGIELYKNNLSLKSVHHDIELKFSYYNNDDNKIHRTITLRAWCASLALVFKTKLKHEFDSIQNYMTLSID